LKNLQVKIRPEELRYEDAVATLFQHRLEDGVHGIKFPVVELHDDIGVWGAICAEKRCHSAHVAATHPSAVMLVSAIPEVSRLEKLRPFRTNPTLFHTPPAKRSTCGIENRFLEVFQDIAKYSMAKKLKAQNRKINWSSLNPWFHSVAAREANFLIKQVYTRGDEEAMKIVRRFPFECRRPLYDAICIHGRYAAQLMQTFPLMAVQIWVHRRPEDENLGSMVLAGERLKTVAERAGIPFILRHIPPQLTNIISVPSITADVLRYHKPRNLPLFRSTISVIGRISGKSFGSDSILLPAAPFLIAGYEQRTPVILTSNEISRRRTDFMIWCAKKMDEAYYRKWNRHFREVEEVFGDLSDWASDTDWRHPWNPDMSLERALEYSSIWHAEQYVKRCEEFELADCEIRVTTNQKVPRYVLPPAWFENWETSHRGKTYSFHPLDQAHKMTEEGERMKNCVNTYRQDVVNGMCYIYSLRVGGKRKKSIATIELRKVERGETEYYINQERGPCNQKVSDIAKTMIGKWCKHFGITRNRKISRPEPEPEPVPVFAEIEMEYTNTTGSTLNLGTAWTISSETATTVGTSITGDMRLVLAATTADTSFQI